MNAKSLSQWMKNSWRPTAAYVYLLICLVDFAGMPIYYAGMAKKNASVENVELALKFEGGAAQVEALKSIRDNTVWQPITLGNNGMFHMVFGAILGVAAWTRGQEKITALKCGVNPDGMDSDTPPTPPTPPNGQAS